MWQCDRVGRWGPCNESTGCVGAGKDLMEVETDIATPLYLPMALLAPLLGPLLLLCSDPRFLEIALVLPQGWRLSTALDPALTRIPPPRDCQAHRTLLCPY